MWLGYIPFFSFQVNMDPILFRHGLTRFLMCVYNKYIRVIRA